MSLEQFASMLENFEDHVLPEIAADAAPRMQDAARTMYARGEGPDGQHAPRKKDGALALQRPLSTVTFAGVGATIAGSAEDVLRYHQGPIYTAPYPQRKTFPADGDPLPASWEKSVEDATNAVMEKIAKELG